MNTVVCIVGLGLIGGSLGKGLRAKGYARVIGVDTHLPSIQQAKAVGAIDEIVSLADGLARADIVVLATPVQTFAQLAQACAQHCQSHTIITDVGSTKVSMIAAFKRAFAGVLPPRVIPAHPLAGGERVGINAAQASLFEHALVFLIREEGCDSPAFQAVFEMWKTLGASPVVLSSEYHDQVLAATSHLPHLLSFALVEFLASKSEKYDIFRFASGGFRDFTRIASSSPAMWRDIFLANKQPILEQIRGLQQTLTTFATKIENEDAQGLEQSLLIAKTARDYYAQGLMKKQRRPQRTAAAITWKCSGKQLQGQIDIPGDKSISHRAMMLGAVAEGSTNIRNFLESEDCMATLNAFIDMGVAIEGPFQGSVHIHGVGLRGLRTPLRPLEMGNSGTGMRLLAGLLAGQTFSSQIQGDESLNSRPMQRIITPLRQMAANIAGTQTGTAPLLIDASEQLLGIHYELPVASAQVKSALLLAGMYADAATVIRSKQVTRDHTERMMRAFDCRIQATFIDGMYTQTLQGHARPRGCDIRVPGDISSAAFFIGGACIAPNSSLVLRNVGINPTRDGILTILKAMGAHITFTNATGDDFEPVADIEIEHRRLVGIDVPAVLVPLAIDELPLIMAVAACADGVTTIRGAAELRVKESDRIAAMVDGLQVLGLTAEATADGAIIQGVGHGNTVSGGTVNSQGDHRIAMAFTMLALRSSAPIIIEDCANVATSFPNFAVLARQTGITIEVKEPLQQSCSGGSDAPLL